jgi:hypothetical protein
MDVFLAQRKVAITLTLSQGNGPVSKLPLAAPWSSYGLMRSCAIHSGTV